MLCEHLEEYVCRLLPSESAVAFERHLESCEACRDAVGADRALFDLVTRAVSLDTPPITITVPKIETAKPKRAGYLATVLSGVALAVLAMVLPTTNRSRLHDETEVVVETKMPFTAPVIELPATTHGVSIPVDDPNIQIVLIDAPPPANLDAL